MPFAVDFVAVAWAVSALVAGLLIGRLWGRAGRGPGRVADSAAAAAAAATARTQADAAQRELAAAQAAMRPLADEVDRLKRELAKARRPVQTPLPGLEPLAPMAPMAPSPAAGPAPVAGLAGDPVAVPDIRQLKGVGDKFAAALSGLGLGTIDRLARLNADEAADADTQLGAFNGRIARDRLVEQCVLLDEGRLTEYETRFGKLGGPVLI
jgi:predicted flap endonuclease-1-like 5' DNA nuclease